MTRKRKRDAMPGGAPMPGAKRSRAKAKKPCAYGERLDNGRCPPKPRAAKRSASRTKEKPPCAYGPRGADGRCPKKGKESVRLGRDVRTIISPKSKGEERRRAARDVGTTVTGHVAAETGKSVSRALKRKGVGKRIAEGAKKLAPVVTAVSGTLTGAAAGTLGAGIGGAYVTSKLMKSRYRKRAQAMLNDTIKRTPAAQRAQYTPAVREQLLRQYEQYLRDQDDALFTK